MRTTQAATIFATAQAHYDNITTAATDTIGPLSLLAPSINTQLLIAAAAINDVFAMKNAILETYRIPSNKLGVRSYKVARHSHKSGLIRSSEVIRVFAWLCLIFRWSSGLAKRPTDPLRSVRHSRKAGQPKEGRRVQSEARLAART